jgi:hypothetical protein
MEMVSPQTGANERTLAASQPEYNNLAVAEYMVEFSAEHQPAYTLLTRWRLSDADRERIANGEDVFVACITFGDALQPLMVQVGMNDPAGTNWSVNV